MTERPIDRFILTPHDVRGMMRQHRHTIRSLAQKMQITQKQVRDARDNGTRGYSAVDLAEAITGTFSGRHAAAYRQARKAEQEF